MKKDIEAYLTESAQYDDVITRLNEAKEQGMPIEEGIIGALVGGVAGVTLAPSLMKAVCKVLGVDTKGQFGSLLTSRLVLGAVCAELGWKK